jgi:tRNA threonylcarbamoyladenosine biosynthesis protein TsaB
MNGFDENAPTIALETSGRIGSIAVGRGSSIAATETFSRPMGHAVELMPALDRLCKTNDIAPTDVGYVYVSAGPGSFTGLRIGVTVARSIALANGAKIVRVPTLDVVAQNALEMHEPPDDLAVILDAKRRRVYAASFRRTGDVYQRTCEPAECDPLVFLSAMPRTAAVIGEGVAYHQEAVKESGLQSPGDEFARARAEAVFRLGAKEARTGVFEDPGDVIPIYIRRPEAEEVWEQRHNESKSTEEA